MKLMVAAFLLLMTAGCVYNEHEVNLSLADATVADATVGRGTMLKLDILDERDASTAGRRGAGIAVAGVKMDDLMAEFERTIRQSYVNKGYTLVDSAADADSELQVALRGVNFSEQTGFFTIGTAADATVLAQAEHGLEDLRKTYRSANEDRQFAASTRGGIDQDINGVLNAVIQDLVDDKELDAFLTQGKATASR